MNKQSKLVIRRCCIAFMISGMTSLSFGAILPELIQDCGISFTVAGGLLSCLSFGNFAANIVYPLLCVRIKEHYVSTVISSFFFMGLMIFTFTDSISILFVMAFLIGMDRGSILLISNRVVNTVSHSSNKYFNLLHMSYAIGAFSSPFAIALLTKAGFDWKLTLRVLALICLVIPWVYYRIGGDDALFDNTCGKREKTVKVKTKKAFLKDAGYLVALVMLFCYVGLEYSVNGWFVTYLQSRNLMSETVATIMVSITWFMMMVGRLVVAKVSTRYSTTTILAVISALQLVAVITLIIGNCAAVVLAAMMLLGLGLSAINPSVISFAGRNVGNSSTGIAILTGMSAFGGIVIPQLIGIIADNSGFDAAIKTVVVDSVAVFLLGLILFIFFGSHRLKGETE